MTASRRTIWRHTLMAAAMAACTTWGAIDTRAQPPAWGNVFLGLAQNRGGPLEIEGDLVQSELDSGVEHYVGNASGVQVKLGDTTIRSRFLTVYYERDGPADDINPADIRKAGLVHIHRLEASGDVTVKYQDQIATGDNAVFDIQANVVTFTGNVVITQGRNQIQGGRLIADLTTGKLTIFPPAVNRKRY
jgi:lipopolysaccharide export system protein LptA